jgi:hypothetical protein
MPQSRRHDTSGKACAYSRDRTAHRLQQLARCDPRPKETSCYRRAASTLSGTSGVRRNPFSACRGAAQPYRSRTSRTLPCRAQILCLSDNRHRCAVSIRERRHLSRTIAAPSELHFGTSGTAHHLKDCAPVRKTRSSRRLSAGRVCLLLRPRQRIHQAERRMINRKQRTYD